MPVFSPVEIAKTQVVTVQDYAVLAWRSLSNLFSHPRYFADTIMQADMIGVGSLPIVVLTGFFTGAVLALQTSNTLEQFAHFRSPDNWCRSRWCASWGQC